jgi:hypothetical protein
MPIDRGPGYEVRDTNVRALVLFAIGLSVMVVVSQAGLWGLLKAISGDEPEPPSPFKAPEVVHEQRVQLQAREHAALQGGYGWTDKAAGTVKIPIEDAMKLIADRGLPVTSTKPRTEVDVNSHAGKAVSEEGKVKP